MSEAAIEFAAVDVVFGRRQREALALLDQGLGRAEILERSGAVLGVAGADLAVPAGEICVLMGLSGSGKSSLLRCVNGLNTVSRGALWVRDGEGGRVDVARADAAALRRLRRSRLAMVFQQFGLLPWATVRENVGFGLSVRGAPAAEIASVVERQLAMVHLQDWGDKAIAELSGGMQQRVGLARAFATDADILLMDEPFSALDPLIREHLQDELLELQRRLKKTILFVSHDLDEALKLGDRIVIMDQARIVQAGSAAEIVNRPVNDYVARFVQHINPLKVLYAAALMQPLAALGEAGWRWVDGRLQGVDGGAPVAARAPGEGADGALRVDHEAWLRDFVVEGLERPWPVLVERGGEVVGFVPRAALRGVLLG